MSSDQIMTSLREATKQLHAEAEQHPVQKRFVSGELTRDGYVAWLGQMLHMHQAFEPELDRLARSARHFTRVLDRYHQKTPLIVDDLQFLGVEAEAVKPTPAATRFAAYVQNLADDRPAALLGVAYVFEGSTNGGKFLVRAARHAYGLAGDRGARYLDPYGQEQVERWGAFRQGMNEADLSPEENRGIVDVACETFRGIIAVLDDIENLSQSRGGAQGLAVPA